MNSVRLGIRVLWVLLLAVGLLVACGNDAAEPEGGDAGAGQTSSGVTPGTYEGEWAMSPANKPLVSLVMDEDGAYEFYISIMGLVEEGTYQLGADGTLTFTPEDGAPHSGTYTEGMVAAPFTLGESPVDLAFIQVGSPDDLYEEFLGDYLTTVMGNREVILELNPGMRYVNTLSGETGMFRIQDGEISLIPDAEGGTTTGRIDLSTKTITATLSLAPNTPSREFTFRMLGPEEMTTYYGEAAKGMGGSTPVTLVLKPANRFELITSRPRGRGDFAIEPSGDTYALTLTYTDPAERPGEGGLFVMTGTISSADPFAADNTLTIDTVEYIVVMQADPSVMDLGTVEMTVVKE
jgi:hypothetical protein